MRKGQVFIEFILSVAPFVIFVLFIILGLLMIIFLGFAYFVLQNTAYQVSTDARLFEGLRLLKAGNLSVGNDLIRSAIADSIESNTNLLLGMFGSVYTENFNFCINNCDQNSNLNSVRLAVLLPETAGVRSIVDFEGSKLRYENFTNFNCRSVETVLNCPVVAVARFHFLGLSFTLSGSTELDLAELSRGTILSTIPLTEQRRETSGSTGSSGTDNRPRFTPSPESCPIEGLYTSSGLLKCRDVMQTPNLWETLVATIASDCGSSQVRVCQDGTCSCAGDTG